MDRRDEVCKPGMYALIVGRHLALAYIDEAVSRTGTGAIETARAAGVGGVVILELTIGADGSVTDAHVLRH